MEMKYSQDKNVTFDKESHVYFKKDKKLLSVTSLIAKYKNEFDSDFWSKKIALKENKTQKEILQIWSDKAKKSCEIGTAIHKIFEDYIENKYSILNENLLFDFLELDENCIQDFNRKKRTSLKFINDFFKSKRLNPIFSEYIVYNDLIAGQIDCICENKKGELFIIDFKTNEKIEINNYGKYLKGILNKIPDSTFYHYSLQLSIYKKLFKKKIKGMYLIHIKNNSYDFIECKDVLKEYNINLKDFFNNA
jgi:hypothetical protein